MDNLREKFAEAAHDSWSGWAKYMLRCCQARSPSGYYLPIHYVERWCRQMATLYADLTEGEKESDRKEADRYLDVLKSEPRFSQEERKSIEAAIMFLDHNGCTPYPADELRQLLDTDAGTATVLEAKR